MQDRAGHTVGGQEGICKAISVDNTKTFKASHASAFVQSEDAVTAGTTKAGARAGQNRLVDEFSVSGTY